MAKHISDSERFAIATLNRRDAELQEAKNKIRLLEAQLSATKMYVWELKDSNMILSNQLRYFIRKYSQ